MSLSDRYVRRLQFSARDFDETAYPFSIPAVRQIEAIDFDSAVTFLVGENGRGKSTILESVAVAMNMNPEGGPRQGHFQTVSTHSILHEYITAIKGYRRLRSSFFLRAESFYNVASYLEEVGSPRAGNLHAMSHGESFMHALHTYARSDGLVLCDEPEAALSVARQVECLRLIHDAVQSGSQFIIATHSPVLLSYPGARIYQLEDTGILEVAYEETETYGQMKYFINNYAGVLRTLLVEDE